MFAFVFPGQGSQKVGMGQDLAQQFPIARQVFERADEALGFSLSRLCFEGPADELMLTANSQPAILTTSIAMLEVLKQETSLTPDLAAGHSLGEYSALVCAGALSFEDAVRTVHQRGRFMQDAVPVGVGAMAAVLKMDPAGVNTLCEDAAEGQVLVPANFNSPGQIVIAGHKEAVERAAALAKERRGIAKLLPVSAPFHCPLMAPAADNLKPVLEAINWQSLQIPVVSNVDAAANTDASAVVDLLHRQVTGSVRWIDCVEQMAVAGVTEFFEVGLGKTLQGLIRQINGDLTTTLVGTPEDLSAIKERLPG
ncbi:MAG: ACP S-malonyltransferase [Pseudomonadota bacterium]